MAKIYNEIVIDMNPESPTFKETLYEDSFEHEGDMMLLESIGAIWVIEDGGNTANRYDNVGGKWGVGSSYDLTNEGMKIIWDQMKDRVTIQDKPPEGEVKPGNTYEDITNPTTNDNGGGDDLNTFTGDPTSTEWGAANIGKDDFINADGTPKTIQEIYNILDSKLPGITGEKLYNQINEMMPKYQGVAEEEKGFLAKERGFAERGAEASKKGDIYQLQKAAGGVGQQMRGAYGGMGGGARGSIGGQAAMTKGMGIAQDAYSLSMDKAAYGEEKGLYDLEKKATTAYETDVSGSLEAGWVKPTEATTGAEDYTATTEWGNWRKGGRVPDKESFSSFLTQLPDAGGM